MDEVERLDIEKIGPYFENHECFPKRINTEFVKVIDRTHVQMRVWERGTGETLACGTGCCATVVACILNGLTDETVTVKLLGGEIQITWDREADLVYMTGPATTVFDGVRRRIRINFLCNRRKKITAGQLQIIVIYFHHFFFIPFLYYCECQDFFSHFPSCRHSRHKQSMQNDRQGILQCEEVRNANRRSS